MAVNYNPSTEPMTQDEEIAGIVKSALASADVDFLYAVAYELQCLPSLSKEESNPEELKDAITRKVVSLKFKPDEIESRSEGLKELKGSDVLLAVTDENAYRFFMLLYNGQINLKERIGRTRFPKDTYKKREFIADLFTHLSKLNIFDNPPHLEEYLRNIIYSYDRSWREIFQSEEHRRLQELWNDDFFSPVMAHNTMKEFRSFADEPMDFIDILIFMDKYLDSQTVLRKVFVKKISDKVSNKRSKFNSDTDQKNFTLKNETIKTLKEFSKTLNKSETAIVNCLIMEELKNPTHLKNILKYIKN